MADRFSLVDRLRHSGGTGLRRLADLVLPPQCLLTGEAVASHGDLSPSVWQKLNFIDAPFCPACGGPWEAEVHGDMLCAACVAGTEDASSLVQEGGLDRVRSALRYDDLSARLVLMLKYADRLDMVRGLSRLMVRAGRDVLAEDAVLVPVPLHRSRLVMRRFNQSALLAAALAEAAGVRMVPDLLVRTRRTPRQQGLSAKGRERNVRGAFAINSRYADEVRSSHFVLIDDVLTTGSTLKACARRLRRGGAERVDAVVLARVVPEGIGAI